MMMDFREGRSSDWRVEELERLGTRWWRRGMLERGGLRGRLVSVPMIRWEAERWLRPERTWGALNAGFSGTFLFISEVPTATYTETNLLVLPPV